MNGAILCATYVWFIIAFRKTNIRCRTKVEIFWSAYPFALVLKHKLTDLVIFIYARGEIKLSSNFEHWVLKFLLQFFKLYQVSNIQIQSSDADLSSIEKSSFRISAAAFSKLSIADLCTLSRSPKGTLSLTVDFLSGFFSELICRKLMKITTFICALKYQLLVNKYAMLTRHLQNSCFVPYSKGHPDRTQQKLTVHSTPSTYLGRKFFTV